MAALFPGHSYRGFVRPGEAAGTLPKNLTPSLPTPKTCLFAVGQPRCVLCPEDVPERDEVSSCVESIFSPSTVSRQELSIGEGKAVGGSFMTPTFYSEIDLDLVDKSEGREILFFSLMCSFLSPRTTPHAPLWIALGLRM